MAYRTRWEVKFENAAGDVIDILIQDDGYEGTTTLLEPASQPFTTEETNDSDAFVPIRTQTGYINIITGNINLVRNIIPRNGSTRKVVVYKYVGGDTQVYRKVFVGWIQPQLIDMDIWRGKQQVGIPVECYLSGLKNKSFEMSGFVPFNDFLADAFSDFTDFYFQCPALSSDDGYDADAFWLNNRFLSELFADGTQYDVLEAICVFFGWTCRMWGDRVYFIANRNMDDGYNPNLFSITLQGLKAISGQAPVAPSSTNWIQQYLTEGAIANKNTSMEMNNGILQAIVKCNLDPYNESISPDESALKQAIYNDTWHPQYIHTDVMEHGLHHVDEYYTSFNEMTVGNVKISGYNVRPQYHYKTGEPTGDLNDATLDIAVLETTERLEEEIHDPEQYEETWREVVEVLSTHYGYLNMDTTESFIFTTGKLRISFTKSKYVDVGYYQIRFRIKVGNYWYNPSTGQWQLQDPGGAITISYGQEYTMPIGNIQGAIHLYIMSKSEFRSWTVTYEAEESETVDSSVREIVHMETTGMDFPVNKEIESHFGLKENLIAMSRNFIFDTQITPRTSLWTDLTKQYTFNPLVRLAEEVAEEMGNLGEIVTIGVKHSVMPNISPLSVMYIEWFDATYYPISIDHDWGNDVDTITLQRRRTASSGS